MTLALRALETWGPRGTWGTWGTWETWDVEDVVDVGDSDDRDRGSGSADTGGKDSDGGNAGGGNAGRADDRRADDPTERLADPAPAGDTTELPPPPPPGAPAGGTGPGGVGPGGFGPGGVGPGAVGPGGASKMLYRTPPGERAAAGVAAGIAAYFDVPAALIRLAFVALTLTGGIGIVLYLAAWIIVPERPAHVPATSPPDGLRMDTAGAWIGLAMIVVAGSILADSLGIGSASLFWAVVLITGGVLLFRRADGADAPPATAPGSPVTVGRPTGTAAVGRPGVPPPPGPAAAPSGYPVTTGLPPTAVAPGYRGPGGTTAPYPSTTAGPSQGDRREERLRDRSPLGRITVALALVVLGGAVLLERTGLLSASAVQIGGAVLLVLGAGLLVGARWGRARGLVLLALLLAPGLLVADSLRINLPASAGEQRFVPTAAGELMEPYRLDAGRMDLDLSGLMLTAPVTEVAASVGFGELHVRVPDDVRVEATGTVGLGELDMAGEVVDGSDLRRNLVTGPPGAPTLRIDANVGLGELTVTPVESAGAGSAGDARDAGDAVPGTQTTEETP